VQRWRVHGSTKWRVEVFTQPYHGFCPRRALARVATRVAPQDLAALSREIFGEGAIQTHETFFYELIDLRCIQRVFTRHNNSPAGKTKLGMDAPGWSATG
jgi:hypothetical protein